MVKNLLWDETGRDRSRSVQSREPNCISSFGGWISVRWTMELDPDVPDKHDRYRIARIDG